ncbi:hypothetical protein AD929_02055 [Gluconobacter potus]|uniref:Uncharacterized protein n=1 Tax=Gluconobacter potus TaxID=2724927 RepID=A0A149QZW5_9PROT|nr:MULTISPECIES: hypothetical protein [Gluconobacter]KXV02674.1 hypothetical protein AD929_02055 [Gluconobacter potus]KXV41826.1 hypothetical protein AD936_12535 [Gluconobacter japonicus]KXV41929.1 hypothetical protein AD942_00805 [Gluconobacter japonicus]
MIDKETTDEIDMLDVLKGRFGAGQGVITLSRDMSDAQIGSVVRASLKLAGGRAITVIPPLEPHYDEFHEFLKVSGDDQ